MSIAPFLAELRSLDIRVWIEGDRLRCDAPPGVLTPELRDRLRASKDALLDFLRGAEALQVQPKGLVPLQPHGGQPPLFAVGGHNGDVFCYRVLARCLGPEQPLYGLQPPGADGLGQPLERVEDMAAYFVEQIRAFQPQGPYRLAGFCAGGTIAFELAQQLRHGGGEISFLALIASPHPFELRLLPTARRFLLGQWQRVDKHARALLQRSLPEQRRYLAEVFDRRRAAASEIERRRDDSLLTHRRVMERTTLAALARYRPVPYPDPVHLFLPSPAWSEPGGLSVRWYRTTEQLTVLYGPDGCTNDDILRETYAPAFAEILRPCLGESS